MFLDEIANLSVEQQNKLLRIVQERRVRPLGEDNEIPVQFRLISATNKDIDILIKQGRFIRDLHRRIRVFEFRLPKLRDRACDIPVLTSFLVQKFASQFGKQLSIDPELLKVLGSVNWVYNVGDLENAIEAAVAIVTAPRLTTEHLPEWVFSQMQCVGTGRNHGPENGGGITGVDASLVFVDDRTHQHRAFRRAIEADDFLDQVRQAAGLDSISLLTWYPYDIPKDEPDLSAFRTTLKNAALLVIDQDYSEAPEPWKNGQVLFAYISEYCPSLATRTIILTRHADKDRVIKYTDEMRRELGTHPRFKDRLNELSSTIPRFIIRAEGGVPFPEPDHPMWQAVRDAILKSAYVYNYENGSKASAVPPMLLGSVGQEISIPMAQELVEKAPAYDVPIGRVDSSCQEAVCDELLKRHGERCCRPAPKVPGLIIARNADILSEALEIARTNFSSAISEQWKALDWANSKPVLKEWIRSALGGYGIVEGSADPTFWKDIFDALWRELLGKHVYWRMRNQDAGEQWECTPLKNNPTKFVEFCCRLFIPPAKLSRLRTARRHDDSI